MFVFVPMGLTDPDVHCPKYNLAKVLQDLTKVSPFFSRVPRGLRRTGSILGVLKGLRCVLVSLITKG